VSALAESNLLRRVADALDPLPNPYVARPTDWIQAKLGEFVWSAQDAVLQSLVSNRYTAVRSAHSTGKSHIASRAVAWWRDVHPIDDVFVVTTAPSAPQVKAILWRYIKAAKRKGSLPGYITEAEVPEWKIDGRLVAWGRKPADLANAEEAGTAFQGIHARYVLVILDEAGGIPEWLWTAVDTLVTAPTNRVLAIGNPDDPSSHFEKVCRPGSGWNVIKISAFDTPAFTGEDVPDELLEVLVGPDWVEERKRSWGEDSALYTSKVLAEFPEVSDDLLIPVSWVRAAIERDLSGEAVTDLGQHALDVARQGTDESVLARIRGGMFRIVRTRRGIGDLMKLTGWISRANRESPGAPFIIDADGMGAGVYDRAVELKLPVTSFFAGRRALNPKRFKNRRSEQWWMVREMFDPEQGLIDIDPEDETLQAQLTSIRWAEDSAGRIVVESKKDMKKRGMPSPDRADTLMMITVPHTDYSAAYSPDPDPSKRPAAGVTDDLLTKEML